ncbi:putative dehydrogenase [Aliiruegeria haliotis]|uniref:Putative dehydrogenase n=1 Tax=Aliiruegeria haliotis TaxID=1280846 RepID=A0A2T0RYC8_9RHOB|nr:Gfo/Idh/MocA family oxidoreductase [Aliiruegeria haliotis]PRY26142.1 putative dehydrogenase [Aliiruegeria haliotis]
MSDRSSSPHTGAVRWGILGCGDVTEVKSGPGLQNVDRSSIVNVMRRDGAKAADYAARHNVPRSTDDADALIHDPEVSAVYVATPPSSHADYAIRAMEAGKDVLVEKPMAMNPAECAAMGDAVKRTGRKLSVAYYRRALPRFEKLREIATDGTIGDVRMVEVRHFRPTGSGPDQPWKIDPAIGGGGLFTDMQSHTLDWLDHAFGAPIGVTGLKKQQGGTYEAEDLVSYILDFGAFPAVGLCAYSTGRDEEVVTIHGSKGSASMGFFRPCEITIDMAGETRTIELPDEPAFHHLLVEKVVAHFLDDAPNPCDVSAGSRTNALLEKIRSGI